MHTYSLNLNLQTTNKELRCSPHVITLHYRTPTYAELPKAPPTRFELSTHHNGSLSTFTRMHGITNSYEEAHPHNSNIKPQLCRYYRHDALVECTTTLRCYLLSTNCSTKYITSRTTINTAKH
jgi:hypothetical protein